MLESEYKGFTVEYSCDQALVYNNVNPLPLAAFDTYDGESKPEDMLATAKEYINQKTKQKPVRFRLVRNVNGGEYLVRVA